MIELKTNELETINGGGVNPITIWNAYQTVKSIAEAVAPYAPKNPQPNYGTTSRLL